MKHTRYNHLLLTPLVLSLFLFLAVMFAPENVRASDNLIFIIDASASMDGQLGDKTKIDSVKNVLTQLAKELPDGQNIGLTVFGGSQKGDCKDVKGLIPLSRINKKVFIEQVQNITPMGMTPLSLALQRTAEKLKKIKPLTTIVLIADGQDTCMGDPCELVGKLGAKKIKSVINVIGLGIPEPEKEQLSCIARDSGGIYFSAKNIGELTAVTGEAIGKPAEKTADAPKKQKKAIKSSDSKTGRTAMLKVRSGRVRQEPSLKSEIKFKLKKGDIVSVTEIKDGWYHIKLDDGRTGWSYQSLFMKTEKSPKPGQDESEKEIKTSDTAILKVRIGRVRQEPSLKSKIKFKLKKGYIVSIIETKGDWYHIKLDDGRYGWSHQKLYKISPEPELAEKREKKVTLEIERGLIREGPSLHFEVIFTIKKGASVSIIGTKNNWYLIRLDDGRTGWAHERLFPQLKKDGKPGSDLLKKLTDNG
ncbi:MAG: SH3 domain-containing protein [Desulfobacteraceae bacterium]|nr:SH3 domain-containing protein [Desulfobacteraceae bacterium]